MITIFILLLIICLCTDWENAENAKERRHREVMSVEKKRAKRKPVKRTRTVTKDEEGRFIAQEILETEED